jgi:hypothetical protein
MIHTRRPHLPENFEPYAAQPDAEGDPMPEHSIVPDVANGSALALFGLSLTDIQQMLQVIALVLGIVATLFTIIAHVRRWRAIRGTGPVNSSEDAEG